jgi:hypothetical protein
MSKTFNIAAFIVGLIGVIISLISYLSTTKNKEISYNIYSPSYKIYDNELIHKTSNLNVFFKDSIKIEQNIYLTTFTIWNSGDLPIDKRDIRSEIEMKFIGIKKLINYHVIKEVEMGVSNIVFTSKNDSVYILDWKFFDPGNGIKVQLLYFGNEVVTSKIDGSIFDVKFKEFVPYQNKRPKSRKFTVIFFLVSPILIWFLSSTILFRMAKNKVQLSWEFLFFVVNPVLFFLISAYLVISFIFKIEEIPF